MRVLLHQIATASIVFMLCITGSLASNKGAEARRPVESKPHQAAPRTVVPYTSFDFGDVVRGEIISQVFVIRNVGDADLVIKEFKGDCGCTATRAISVIPAGKEGTVEAEVQTVSQSGAINKFATLRTNEPEKPTVVFTLTANVISGSNIRPGKRVGPLFITPGSMIPMYAMPGKKASAEVSITVDDGAVKVLGVEAGTKNFIPRLEIVEPGKTYKLIIDSAQIETSGMYKDKVTITTDHPTLPKFTVDVALRVYEKS
jgi:hypothetical protein